MKKLVTILIACFAFVQSHAATSALTESLLEYEAIISALGTDPSFENVIPASEFIVDIRRMTHKVDVLGKVKYKIAAQVVGRNGRTVVYLAILNVAPNPGVGPNIVTVESIDRID